MDAECSDFGTVNTWRNGLIAKSNKKILCIIGPTCSGKSALALAAARAWQGEIVSCDSVQVYKGFDIGSAKPGPEERALVAHHLLDVISCNETMDAAKYADLAQTAIQEILARKKLPVIVGGSGLYFRALCGYKFHDDLPQDKNLRARLAKKSKLHLYQLLLRLDPERARELHVNDTYRITRALEIRLLSGKPLHEIFSEQKSRNEVSEFQKSALVVYLKPPVRELHVAIANRTRDMLQAGLVDEVKAMLSKGCRRDCAPMQSIGYKQVVKSLGYNDVADLENQIVIATRQYAKKQKTWFNAIHKDLEMECFGHQVSLENIGEGSRRV